MWKAALPILTCQTVIVQFYLFVAYSDKKECVFLNILSMTLFTEHIIIYSDGLTNRKLAFAYKYTHAS